MLARRNHPKRKDLQAWFTEIDGGSVSRSRRNKGIILGRFLRGETLEGGHWLLNGCRNKSNRNVGMCSLIGDEACARRNKKKLEKKRCRILDWQ